MTVAMLALISAVMATAITVTLRQNDSTSGRVSVARAEASIGIWLPTDLASVDRSLTPAAIAGRYGPGFAGVVPVDVTPGADPCGTCGAIDTSGANVLQLSWFTETSGGAVVTTVQYQHMQVGDEWQLQRIECVGAEPCRMNVVLHDLTAAIPLTVNVPVGSNATEVSVTIDGGGTGSGAGGGANLINVTAGGVVTDTIPPDEFSLPQFVRFVSRCGGPITLIADNSGSIGSTDIQDVELGMIAVVDAFTGAPVQLQIIGFGVDGFTVGATGGERQKYFDMTDLAQVATLRSAIQPAFNGQAPGTNWEDGWYRAVRKNNGDWADTIPGRVIFFTDGLPNRNRRDNRSDSAPDLYEYIGQYPRSAQGGTWPNPSGNTYHQESVDRTMALIGEIGADVIAVGVGSGIGGSSNWSRDFALPTSPASIIPNGPSSPVYTSREDILSRTIFSDSPFAERATPPGGPYTNAETAKLYLLSDYATFGEAMKAAALKECGGTITLQTKLADGTSVPDQFDYENTGYVDDSGNPTSDLRTVYTNDVFKSGTLDFEHGPSDAYFDVDIVPRNVAGLGDYTFDNWSCRVAGVDLVSPDIVVSDLAGIPGWKQLTVRVRANEAVSCVHTVSEVSP